MTEWYNRYRRCCRCRTLDMGEDNDHILCIRCMDKWNERIAPSMSAASQTLVDFCNEWRPSKRHLDKWLKAV